MIHPTSRALGALALLVLLLVGCSSDPAPEAAFCERLKEATGPTGAESLYGQFDPTRLDQTAAELSELAELAPPDMAETTEGLAEMFTELSAAPDEDRSNIVVQYESEMRTWSAELTSFAIDDCGLLLQRAPTPTPESAPLVLDG